ncbi:MAG: hypothetical protein ACQETB_09285 [Halobacteriota archaeon]
MNYVVPAGGGSGDRDSADGSIPDRPDSVPADEPVDLEAVFEATLEAIEEGSYYWEYDLKMWGDGDEPSRDETQVFELDRSNRRLTHRTEMVGPAKGLGIQDVYRTDDEGVIRRDVDDEDGLSYHEEKRSFDMIAANMYDAIVARTERLVGPHEFGPAVWDAELDAFVAPLDRMSEDDDVLGELADPVGELRVDPEGLLQGYGLSGRDPELDEHVRILAGLSTTDIEPLEEPSWVEAAREAIDTEEN